MQVMESGVGPGTTSESDPATKSLIETKRIITDAERSKEEKTPKNLDVYKD